jgi:hypothetical protein
MPQIQNVASGTIYQVTRVPAWVKGMWECGSMRFYDPSGAQFINPAPGGVMPVPELWLCFTVTEEANIRTAAAGGTLPAGAAFTTSSPSITMAAANPGWVVPGMIITDHSLNGPSSGLYVGSVLTYVGASLTLGVNAATASLGAADMLTFSGDSTIATWLNRMDDARTTSVDLSYLTTVGLLAAGRSEQVLAGVMQ